ncbi:MAG: flagellar M-ring protein FliF [Acidobacteria bacterium]|nr:flagellar M-ring protein FliF [Acidobacteriota bacterium]
MAQNPKKVFSQLLQTWERLNYLQRISIVALPLALAGSIAAVVGFVNREQYEVVYGNLESADAAQVISALKQKRVPYRLERDGTAISVPVESVAEVRMDLASQGLPRGGGAGFEVFDQNPFGMSDFMQDVNYQRAMERELERSIESIDSVAKARVHLVLPKDSIFANEKNDAKASVVIRMKAGRDLKGGEIASVTHVVASAVKGLKPENVSLVDTNGRMLSDGASDDGSPGAMTLKQLEIKDQVEKYLTAKLLNILEPLVGEGRVRARADAQLNMARVERTLEQYDPAGAVVRSEQKSKEKRGSAAPAGTAGAASNLPEGQQAAVAPGPTDETSSSTINYEINKTVQHLVEPVGTITRLSVAVVVDNVPGAPAAKAGGPPSPSVPRTPEEMAKFADLVKAAVGFDATRGDTVKVENVAFGTGPNPADELAREDSDKREFYLRAARYPAMLAAALLAYFLLLRPLMKSFGATLRALGASLAADGPSEGALATLAAVNAGGRELPAALRDEVREIAGRDPARAAKMISQWMAEEKS